MTVHIEKHLVIVSLLIGIALVGYAACAQTEEFHQNALSIVPSVSSASDSWFSLSKWKKMIFSEGESNAAEGRTFGLKRRLQMFMIPLVFKFGIISTLIFMLVALGLKTVFLLKTLLVLNLAGIIAKLFIWKSEVTEQKQQVHYTQWIPPPPIPVPYHASQKESPLGKEVHLHIHNNNAHGNEPGPTKWEPSPTYHHEHNAEPYGAYSNQQSNYVQPIHRRSLRRIPVSFQNN